MISSEPVIQVGIIENSKIISGLFNGLFELPNSIRLKGSFAVRNVDDRLVFFDDENVEVARSGEFVCRPIKGATFTIQNVSIGINFHWEKKEHQTFEGSLKLVAGSDGTITAINEIGIESYLKSVISSEMSAESPMEFLKTQAIASRSWLVAELEKQTRTKDIKKADQKTTEKGNEIIRWYDREDHVLFDVCADDHCQRYQGITKIISKSADEAVNSTRGEFLVHNGQICDARFSKSCGGRTELYENCWDDTPVAYLQSVSDSEKKHPPISNEEEAERWILSLPNVFCNTSDREILSNILPSYDRTTADFFRWKVEYSRKELEDIIRKKSGIDIGALKDIVPIQRGPSGRIHKLKIVGGKQTIIIGKELEIRRWLSNSHLYSSSFIVKIDQDGSNVPKKITFHGAGWGHGVGLCQIGAAVMAIKGFTAEKILKHYFSNVEIKKLY